MTRWSGSIHWVQGAVEKAGSHGHPEPPELLEPVDIEINTSDSSLSELLAAGEIDAILGSRLPTNLGVHPDVVRLFPDYRAVERDYYQRTRIHPIMHLVVIRRDVYDANPRIAASLWKAFEAAKAWALEEMRFSGAQRYMLPWLYPDLDEVDELFGGDPWEYGLGERNRHNLETAIGYSHECGLISRKLSVDELFSDPPISQGRERYGRMV